MVTWFIFPMNYIQGVKWSLMELNGIYNNMLASHFFGVNTVGTVMEPCQFKMDL